MKPGFTPVPNDLFEAALKFKCPEADRRVIFAVIRLTEGYHQPERALSVSYLSKFLGVDKSNIAKRLNSLIEANVLRETSHPGCQEARHIEINRNFREWIPVKKAPAKGKAHENPPENPGSESFLVKKPETTTVAESTTPPVVESATNKDTSSALFKNKKTAVAVVLKKGGVVKTPPQQRLNKGNLEEELKGIFEHSLGRKPNLDEVYELRKQVLNDERFSLTENMTILKNAFHRAAISEESKKHTVYILGIIRSMKQEKLKQRDKALKAQETNAAFKPKFISWDDAGFSLIEDYRNQFEINNANHCRMLNNNYK